MLKKVKLFIVAVAAVFICVGCSHNVVTYSDGVGFETTMRPDTGNFGIAFRYGKILSVTARENTEVEMAGAGNAGAGKENAASTAADGNVKMKIGKQITGYYVDAIKAGATPEQLDKYGTSSK